MSTSSRWPLGLGLISVILCTALAVLASHLSESAPASSSSSSASLSSHSSSSTGAASSQSPARSTAAPDSSRATIAQPITGTAPEPAPPSIAALAGIVDPAEAAAGPRNRSIEATVQPLLGEPRLRAGVYGVDLRDGAFFDLLGTESFAAASLIKIPIVVALLMEVDRGAIRLDEILEMQASQVATGSGSIQYQAVGTRFSIRRLAEIMIRRSDNTATNMLIDRLGGIATVNSAFAAWGLSRTVVRAPLPDLEGTNRTSPRDLVTILRRAVSGGLLAAPSRDLLLSWMRRTHVRSLLPSGTGPEALVANKTGDIPGALGDAGYVESGDRRYLLAVQVERPRNSGRAKELIRRVSRAVYHSITGRTPLVPPRRIPRSRAGLRRPNALRSRSNT